MITVFLTEDIKDIINRLGNPDKSPDNYIFSILKISVTSLERFDIVRAFNKFINDGMAKIAERVGIEKKVTTLVSRHTLSTQMKKLVQVQSIFRRHWGILISAQQNIICTASIKK